MPGFRRWQSLGSVPIPISRCRCLQKYPKTKVAEERQENVHSRMAQDPGRRSPIYQNADITAYFKMGSSSYGISGAFGIE